MTTFNIERKHSIGNWIIQHWGAGIFSVRDFINLGSKNVQLKEGQLAPLLWFNKQFKRERQTTWQVCPSATVYFEPQNKEKD